MPCTDGGPSRPDPKVEAMLCAIVSSMDPDDLDEVLDDVNWREAGVTRAEFQVWWEQHQAEDASRRERESAAAEVEQTRRRALAKLTPAERAAIAARPF